MSALFLKLKPHPDRLQWKWVVFIGRNGQFTPPQSSVPRNLKKKCVFDYNLWEILHIVYRQTPTIVPRRIFQKNAKCLLLPLLAKKKPERIFERVFSFRSFFFSCCMRETQRFLPEKSAHIEQTWDEGEEKVEGGKGNKKGREVFSFPPHPPLFSPERRHLFSP